MHIRSINHQQKQKETTKMHNSVFQSKREQKETDGHMNTGLSIRMGCPTRQTKRKRMGVHGHGWLYHWVLNMNYLSVVVVLVSTSEKVARSDIKKAIPLSGHANGKQGASCVCDGVMVWVSMLRYLSLFVLVTTLRVIWKYEHLGQVSKSDRLCARKRERERGRERESKTGSAQTFMFVEQLLFSCLIHDPSMTHPCIPLSFPFLFFPLWLVVTQRTFPLLYSTLPLSSPLLSGQWCQAKGHVSAPQRPKQT